jgi:LEA14-like dessication related protein
MKSLPAPLSLLLLVTFFLAGCGGPNTTTVGLKIELTRVVRQANGGAQVTWRVVNPNIVPYLLARATHHVYLDGVAVGTLDDSEALAIPAQTNQERTTTLAAAGTAAEQALAAAAKAGAATYRLDSNVIVRLYGDTVEKSELHGAGTVPVSGK